MLQAIKLNAAGLAEIRAFLAVNHKLGGAHFTDEMIRAWARDAEFQIAEGNPASIEIKSQDSVRGYSVDYQISKDGQDWAEVWEAWEDGARDDAARFLVPVQPTNVDVAELGAAALGVDVSDRLNVARV